MIASLVDFASQGSWLVGILLFLLVVGVVIHLLGFVSSIQFSFTKAPKPKADPVKGYPSVTIIKPCRENNDNEQENFDAFFNQDYPGKLELLFVVADESHAIVPVVKNFLRKYPEKDARIVMTTSQLACSPKTNSLFDGHKVAKHDIIIWSDSDVIVGPEYVSEMVGSLQEPGVSVVTTPQYDTRANNFGSAYKVLANNCDLAVFVFGYRIFARNKKVAWGHSSGFWKAELDSFGEEAWTFLNAFVADDLGLPKLYTQHGKKVVWRNIYCPVECSNKTVSQMVEQKKRWVVCQRLGVGNRYVYLFGLVCYPEIPTSLLLLVSGFHPVAWALFGVACLLRIGISGVFEFLYLKSLRMTLKYFWTVPLWDLSQYYFFYYGFTTDTITFRGIRYRIQADYSLVPLGQEPSGGDQAFGKFEPKSGN